MEDYVLGRVESEARHRPETVGAVERASGEVSSSCGTARAGFQGCWVTCWVARGYDTSNCFTQ